MDRKWLQQVTKQLVEVGLCFCFVAAFVLSASGFACHDCMLVRCQTACSGCQLHVLPHITMPAKADLVATTFSVDVYDAEQSVTAAASPCRR